MSSIAADTKTSFFATTVGQKIVMAVTGVVLAAFVVGHVAGNLQIFAGATAINRYSALLHASAELLWAVRLVLLAALVLHVRAALSLYARKGEARPVPYAKTAHRASTLASRTMIWSGYALAAFIVYHLLHFTTGNAHPDFIAGDVFHNVTSAFRSPAIAGIYVVAMVFLSLHLSHGLFSLTQSLGLSNPRHAARARAVARVLAVVIAAGFAAVPIAVLAAVIK
jgi:succinate dehydrogenase / fumarate reductase cytochrome b subunit